jgi:Leucine-rich repeat (LRR) protein
MKITSVLSNLITEQSRFQVLYDKLVKPTVAAKPTAPGQKPKGAMDLDTLKTIIFADPTTRVPQDFDKEGATLEDMDNVKVGKYTQWMLKHFIRPTFTDERADIEVGTPEYKRVAQEYRRMFLEDIDKLGVDLLKHERFKGRIPEELRDINKITPEQLYTAVEDFKLSKDSKSNKAERLTKENPFAYPGSKIDFVSPSWTVVTISDMSQPAKEAGAFFGGYYDTADQFGETSWCTSKLDGTYFDYYLNQGGQYYVVLPNNDTEFSDKTGLPKNRYQFHFPSSQFMNRRDRQINLVEFLNGEGKELKEYFKKEFAEGLVKTGGDTVEVNYPESSSGKFVALYGFDELFESLPDTIIRLLISNKSNENIVLEVPDSVGRFVNLEALLLQNICKSLPESIGNLKNLQFLSLQNNPSLESIPESVSELPELVFINLRNSNPNIKIPEKVLENLSEQEPGFWIVS